MQRRQPLGDHSFEVALGEAGQRREVAVQEAQPVVVVLQVQASAHALRELVDEAELAVVVARADPVEQRVRDLGAERDAGRLDDLDVDLDALARRARDRRCGSSVHSRHSMMSRGHGRSRAARRRRARDRRARAGEPGAMDTTTGADMAASRVPGAAVGWIASVEQVMGVDRVLLAEPRGFCAGVEMAIKALAWMVQGVRAARVLLPRDRAQPAHRGALRASGGGVRGRHRRGPRRPPDHAVGPWVGAGGGGGRPRPRQLRRRLGVPARHEGPPRGARPCREGLPHRVRRSRGPRGGSRHDGSGAGRDQPGGVGGRRRRPRGVRRAGGAARPDHAVAPRLERCRGRGETSATPMPGRRDAAISASPPPTGNRR